MNTSKEEIASRFLNYAHGKGYGFVRKSGAIFIGKFLRGFVRIEMIGSRFKAMHDLPRVAFLGRYTFFFPWLRYLLKFCLLLGVWFYFVCVLYAEPVEKKLLASAKFVQWRELFPSLEIFFYGPKMLHRLFFEAWIDKGAVGYYLLLGFLTLSVIFLIISDFRTIKNTRKILRDVNAILQYYYNS